MGIILLILGGIIKKREVLKVAGKGTIVSVLRIIKCISNNLCSVVTSAFNFLRRRYRQADFYLTRRGIRKMKLNLTLVPNVEGTWNSPYLTSSIKKACYLAAQLSKLMNSHDANQRAISIQQLCGTAAIRVLLEGSTLNSDVFCALVSAYVVENTQEYSQERFQSFPIPYSVIEEIVKDLIGEEEEEFQEADSGS